VRFLKISLISILFGSALMLPACKGKTGPTGADGSAGTTQVVVVFSPTPDNSYTYAGQWGGNGAGNGQFNYPNGIAADGLGNLYVTDTNNRIQKFLRSGAFVTSFGSFGTPWGLAADSSGCLFITSRASNCVFKYTSAGVSIGKYGSTGSGNGDFREPFDVDMDSNGNRYVADTFNHRIQKFDSSGVFVTKWGANNGDGTSGSGDGEFVHPAGVAVGKSGNVYVADMGNNRIQKFTSSGFFIAKWGANGGNGTAGTGNVEFNSPSGVEVDAFENVFVSDTYNHRIQKLTSSGGFLCKWGLFGAGAGEFQYPGHLALDTAGNVYVADTNNHRVQVFAP
jgi:tripartite motif-containing protein 71